MPYDTQKQSLKEPVVVTNVARDKNGVITKVAVKGYNDLLNPEDVAIIDPIKEAESASSPKRLRRSPRSWPMSQRKPRRQRPRPRQTTLEARPKSGLGSGTVTAKRDRGALILYKNGKRVSRKAVGETVAKAAEKTLPLPVAEDRVSS